jgi:GT2 family glycosyltransferase
MRLLLSRESRDSASNLGVVGGRVRQQSANRIRNRVVRAVTLSHKDSLSDGKQSTATVPRHHFNIFIEVQKFAHATVWVR